MTDLGWVTEGEKQMVLSTLMDGRLRDRSEDEVLERLQTLQEVVSSRKKKRKSQE